MIKHQMQLETKEPARACFAARGQSFKHLVAADPAIVAHDERRAVDVINVRFAPHAAGEKKDQKRPYAFRQRYKTPVARSPAEIRAEHAKHNAVIKRLEVLEARAVVQNQERHDLAVAEAAFRPMFPVWRLAVRHQRGFPLRLNRLAKIVRHCWRSRRAVPGLTYEKSKVDYNQGLTAV